MRRKPTILAVASVVFGLFMVVKTHAVQKHSRNAQISVQFQRLLQEHQHFIQTVYSVQNTPNANVTLAKFEQDFFLNTAFLQDANIQNFFRSVEADMDQTGKAGYTMMSYTNFIMIGGQTRSIQYTYQSNGNDITLVKQTNDNGNLLKSVYFYDINTKSLKADDYKANEVVHEKVYKI